jgi:hypothetical protein
MTTTNDLYNIHYRKFFDKFENLLEKSIKLVNYWLTGIYLFFSTIDRVKSMSKQYFCFTYRLLEVNCLSITIQYRSINNRNVANG